MTHVELFDRQMDTCITLTPSQTPLKIKKAVSPGNNHITITIHTTLDCASSSVKGYALIGHQQADGTIGNCHHQKADIFIKATPANNECHFDCSCGSSMCAKFMLHITGAESEFTVCNLAVEYIQTN